MVAFAIAIIVAIPVALAWVAGIDHMNSKHPDYDGDDMFGETKNKNNERSTNDN